jgi:hypothetical protein
MQDAGLEAEGTFDAASSSLYPASGILYLALVQQPIESECRLL